MADVKQQGHAVPEAEGAGAAASPAAEGSPLAMDRAASGPAASSLHGKLRTWIRDVVISVAVSLFIITFLYQPVRVEGTSMQPRLRDQERLFINKFSYRVGTIHRDDVVVFEYPRDPSKSYIKRVIGMPGDDLRIDHGRVFVNGSPVAEPYVAKRFADDRSLAETVIPAGEYFVMGDHRSISSDSRDFGPVDRKFIYGKAEFVYWPMADMGSVR